MLGGEAILQSSGGVCNLSEVVVRPDDTLETLKEKIRYATILGTLQSTLTNFRYLRNVWKQNAEEERLLGVSLTGIMDHEFLSTANCSEWLKEMKQEAKNTNERWAEKLGINKSKQLTLIKPSGSVSLLAGCASGIHPRYSKHYIRRVTQDIKDPLTNLMKDEKIPYVVVGDKVIFSFFIKAPKESKIQANVDALEQLEIWKVYQEHWCDGNPSQTIYYTDENFLDMCSWVWKNWDNIGGLSFFPINDHVYENAPYEEITEDEYNILIKTFPETINWERLSEYEKEDCTTATQDFACTAGKCEI